MLHIREFSAKRSLALSRSSGAAGAQDYSQPLSPVLVSPSRVTLPADPVKRLQYESNLKEKYARECFEKNGCDYERAWANFLELQEANVLPSDMFEVQSLWL